MAAKATDYERVNCIVTRDMKRDFVRWCEDHDMSMTQAMRASIRNLLNKQEENKCQTKLRKKQKA